LKVLGDGCNPDRETWVALENAGFESVNYHHFQAPVPIVSPHIAGVATKNKLEQVQDRATIGAIVAQPQLISL